MLLMLLEGRIAIACRKLCYSDITVFSFHPVKIITTGEGGMTLTNEKTLADRMARRAVAASPRSKTDGPSKARSLVLRAAGTRLQLPHDRHSCGVGLSQLDRLEKFVTRRNELAQRYDQALEDLPVKRQLVPENTYSARHLFVIRISSRLHHKLFTTLRSKEIGVNLHYMPVHLQPYYLRLGFKEGDFPEAEAYGLEAISLPLFPSMTNEQQNEVIRILTSELQ